MSGLNLKPMHKTVQDYYSVLGQMGRLHIDHEMAVRSAFQKLLTKCGHQFDWTLVPEYSVQPKIPWCFRQRGTKLRPGKHA
jgi:hypothetical protein